MRQATYLIAPPASQKVAHLTTSCVGQSAARPAPSLSASASNGNAIGTYTSVTFGTNEAANADTLPNEARYQAPAQKYPYKLNEMELEAADMISLVV